MADGLWFDRQTIDRIIANGGGDRVPQRRPTSHTKYTNAFC